VAGGHIHDGGINTEIYQNGRLICDSRAAYAVGSSSHMDGSHSTTAARHIASMSGCRSSAGVKAGDKFEIVVNYDFVKNPG
jgi:Stress up-regulated Nod 19